MNIQEEGTEVDLSSYEEWMLAARLSADGNPILLEGTTLQLPPYGTAVLVLKEEPSN